MLFETVLKKKKLFLENSKPSVIILICIDSNISFRSQLLKFFYKSTEGAHNPGELCKYNYDRQAKE
jgi:hypothetical protein